MPYRPTDRTRARLAQARERIVDAALDQLAEGGYASASVATVARRSQVATGTVYRHFPSKQELFAEVFRRAAQREVDALRDATGSGDSAATRLAAWVEAFVRRALAEPVRAYALIAELVDPAIEAGAVDVPARLRRPLRRRRPRRRRQRGAAAARRRPHRGRDRRRAG